MFNNNKAKLECIIAGQDQTIVNGISISWKINGQIDTAGITESTKDEGGQHFKTSTMTKSLDDWQRVDKVRCTATSDDMTPIIQDLTVHRGGMLLSDAERWIGFEYVGLG